VPATRKPSVVEAILSLSAIALALWVVVSTVNVIRTGWVVIPTADDWDRWVSYVTRSSTAGWLFAQHYDHRIAVPKLLFLVDELAFHARGWFLVVCSLVFQSLTVAMMWRLAGWGYPQTRSERVVQASILVCWMFSAQQWINFVMPFQVQFELVYTAAAGTLFCVWKSAVQNWKASWMIAGILLGAIATFSMANGILIFPVAILAGAWLGMPRRWMVVVTAGALGIVVAYFATWHGSPHPTDLTNALIFGLTLIGSPATRVPRVLDKEWSRIAFIMLPAAILGIGLIVAFLQLWRRRDRYNQAFGVLVFYGLFLAGTAASIAYGRSNGPATEAFEPRYLTPAYLFWGCMLLIGWPLLRRMTQPALYAALCALTLIGVALPQRAVPETVEWWADLIRLGEVAVADNVTDPAPWGHLYYKPDAASIDRINQTAVQYFRTHHLSTFSEEWANWPGIQLTSRFSIDSSPGACEGIFAQINTIQSPLRPGWRLAGWAWDKKAGRTPRYVILADAQGKVAGVARTGFIPPPELAIYSPRYKTSTWLGYVSGEIRKITAYALESDGRSLCRIDSQTLPGGIENPVTDLGVILPKLPPKISSGWSLDGYPKGPDGPGAPASGGRVYGTFPERNTGSIQMGTYSLGRNAGIAIPFLTGSEAHNLSILVRDAASKEVFAKLAIVPAGSSWRIWHPDLPADRELNLEIVAEDQGSGPGEWLAIGWPHLYHRLQ
jgi:hypothetical protein